MPLHYLFVGDFILLFNIIVLLKGAWDSRLSSLLHQLWWIWQINHLEKHTHSLCLKMSLKMKAFKLTTGRPNGFMKMKKGCEPWSRGPVVTDTRSTCTSPRTSHVTPWLHMSPSKQLGGSDAVTCLYVNPPPPLERPNPFILASHSSKLIFLKSPTRT